MVKLAAVLCVFTVYRGEQKIPMHLLHAVRDAVSILAAVDARQQQLPRKRAGLLGARDLAHRKHSSECSHTIGPEHVAACVNEG